MNYLKYILALVLSITFYSCNPTKNIVSETTKDNVEVIEITPEVELEVENIDETKEIGVEETVITEIHIENDVQTDNNTVVSTIDHSHWDELLQKHVSNFGNVNYKGFNADKTTFNTYLKMLSNNPPEDSWSKDETLAYWMNVYNAYTIKLILNNYPTKSIKDIDEPWSERFIKIGDKWYTLNDVEHRIIRKMDEPRIHFALVCAAVSCPKLYNKAFTANNLEADLELLTKGFLNDTSKNEFSEYSIKISKIFKWYGGDFKTRDKDLIDFFNQYMDVKISQKAKKRYKEYDWSLNE